jgi:CRISPR-associated protein Cas2
MFVVVSYDIVDDRRRTKIHDTLKDFGARVQYSVFECQLDAQTLKRLKNRLKPLINPDEDGIRFYFLCETDVRKVRVMGLGQVTRLEPFRIV